MICPNCRTNIPDSSTACPNCGTPILHPRVIEPEVIGSSSTEREVKDAEYEAPHRTQFTRVFYTTFPGGGRGGYALPTGCLPTFISLGLALAMGIQETWLAALAFLVFAAIGRAFIFFMTIQHWMQGRAANQWVMHIVTWGICWALVVLLNQ